jgi:hypothetical protein
LEVTVHTGGGVLDVANQKGKSELKTTPVKIDVRLARKAKTIAEDKGIPLSDYLSSIIQGQIDRDWGKVLKKIVEVEEGGAK